jgi:hypothetical protein
MKAGAVGLVVADADDDAGDPLMAAGRALGGAELGLGFEVVYIFNAVLDEEGFFESF